MLAFVFFWHSIKKEGGIKELFCEFTEKLNKKETNKPKKKCLTCTYACFGLQFTPNKPEPSYPHADIYTSQLP